MQPTSSSAVLTAGLNCPPLTLSQDSVLQHGRAMRAPVEEPDGDEETEAHGRGGEEAASASLSIPHSRLGVGSHS